MSLTVHIHENKSALSHIQMCLMNARQPNTTGKVIPPIKGSKTQKRKANLATHRGTNRG